MILRFLIVTLDCGSALNPRPRSRCPGTGNPHHPLLTTTLLHGTTGTRTTTGRMPPRCEHLPTFSDPLIAPMLFVRVLLDFLSSLERKNDFFYNTILGYFLSALSQQLPSKKKEFVTLIVVLCVGVAGFVVCVVAGLDSGHTGHTAKGGGNSNFCLLCQPVVGNEGVCIPPFAQAPGGLFNAVTWHKKWACERE